MDLLKLRLYSFLSERGSHPSWLTILAQVTACTKDGAPFNLAGCEADTCRSWPSQGDFNQGYVVCHGKRWKSLEPGVCRCLVKK